MQVSPKKKVRQDAAIEVLFLQIPGGDAGAAGPVCQAVAGEFPPGAATGERRRDATCAFDGSSGGARG